MPLGVKRTQKKVILRGNQHHQLQLLLMGHGGMLGSSTLLPGRCECDANDRSRFLSRGSAWANTVAQYSQTIFLFLYIVGKKLHVKTWGGKASLTGSCFMCAWFLNLPALLLSDCW